MSRIYETKRGEETETSNLEEITRLRRGSPKVNGLRTNREIRISRLVFKIEKWGPLGRNVSGDNKNGIIQYILTDI